MYLLVLDSVPLGAASQIGQDHLALLSLLALTLAQYLLIARS